MELDFTSDTVEKLFLKKALSDKSWLDILSNVFDKRWFRTKNMGIVLSLVLKFYDKYGKVPNAQLVSALAKKFSESHPSEDFKISEVNAMVAEAMNMNLGLDEDVVRENMREFIRKNALTASLMDNIDLLSMSDSEKDSSKYQKIVDKCLENFDRVQKITFSDNDLGLSYFDKQQMEKHWDFLKNPDMKIGSKWDSVDKYTNGGFLKDGRMIALIMAQAGLGKSVFLSNLAVNFLKQNLSVVVISLEMSQDVYAQRFDAHISNKNINRLAENEKVARERIMSFYGQYRDADLIIKEYPPRSINTKTIDAYLEKLKAAGKRIDVIIVDYLNLVLPNKVSDSMFKDGLSVSEELRALSYKYNAPVISACQCNSEGMNSEEIDMQNISESRGIVHTVDFLAALYQTQEQREHGKIGFKIIKNRLGGMVGKRSIFKMDPETLVVSDVTFSGDIDLDDESDSELAKIASALPDVKNDITDI